MSSQSIQTVQTARDQLKKILDIWHTLSANFPNPFLYNNSMPLTPSDIAMSIKDCTDQLSDICDQTNPEELLLAVHAPGISATVIALTNFIPTGNPAVIVQNYQNICNHLWSLKSILVWVTPFNGKNSAFATSKLNDLERKAKTLRSVITDIEEIKHAKSDIQKSQAEIANANSAFQISASRIADDRKSIEDYLKNLETIVEAQKREIEEFQKAQSHIKEALEGSSQLGLAKSFMNECKRHLKLVSDWEIKVQYGFKLLVVTAGIETLLLLIIAISGRSSYELLTFQPYLLPLISTAIFYLWYAIKQRGIYRNLAEDYAFKQAAAMSFYGYRTEMGDDFETLKYLRQVAIENFGMNPLRLLQKDEPASPLHDGLDAKRFEAVAKVIKEFKEIFK